jgi:transposase InsO family protein
VTPPTGPAEQAEAAIVEQLRDARPTRPPTRRGRLTGRLRARRRQDLVRRHAVAVAADIAAVGYTRTEIADLLHVTARTLRQWRHAGTSAGDSIRLIGRPARRSAPGHRNAVIEYLDLSGPGVGLPPLRAAFPTMTRAELDDLLVRYRRVWRHRQRQPLHVLDWTAPGAVWAMDFAEAPAVIDGVGAYLLAVRDLASGRQLLWQPVREPTAAATAEALAGLFAVLGPPLVLKSDNGSAFGAPAVATLLHNFGVLSLFSPPHTPSYNGAIEAGIGSLKARTAAHAARHGRPGCWTWDDLAAARLEANATARPRGLTGPTPDEAWAARASIPVGDRVSFAELVEDHRWTARRELVLPPSGPLPVMTGRAVDRIAIRRALVDRGVLLFSRRSIPQPVARQKAEAIP